MKKKLIPVAAVLAVILLFWMFSGSGDSGKSIMTSVQQGEFVVNVTVKGELDAEKSTNINGPMGLQSINIYSDIKIDDLVPEGTIVDSGDYIASLDQTVILDKLKEIDANLEKLTSNINKSKIDSALELRTARDQLVNQKYALEEKEIELSNSKYEPPATQRKLEIDLEKAKRQLQQSIESYELKREKQINTINEAVIDYNKDLAKKEQIMKVMSEFRVLAPQEGMVIYAKSWGGKKKIPGSTISPWNPRVATLPDLSQMQIKSYVNEIDISKVKVGQEVQISVDAFPDKKLGGEVVSVANIGEELKNSSAHVFEVVIKVWDKDEDLRPAMITKNTIITETVDSALYIPLECLHSNDSLVFVYANGGKQIVETAQSNEDNIIVTKGLSLGDEIHLSVPEGAEDWKFRKE
jgi:multidrug efflux pump subunit AcrA (membrane-fusion protein)